MNYPLWKFLDVNRVNVFVFKFKEKSGSTISAFLSEMIIIYKNRHNYWHNFRNMRALLVEYYATFSSTIYQSLAQFSPGF